MRCAVNGSTYLEFADKKPGDDTASKIIRGMGLLSNIKTWIGADNYHLHKLGEYVDATETTEWRRTTKPISIKHQQIGKGDDAYNVMTGVGESDIPF